MLDRMDETIVAVSSAPGSGQLGIVRLDGPAAISIADRMGSTASGEPLSHRPGYTRVEGWVSIGQGHTLPASFYLFRAPHSYTRNDAVEIHTVGAAAALEIVRGQAVALGARPAEPGEFTARAFLNGAMDLSAAEAVAGVIQARTDTQLRASRRMMGGALATRVTSARDELAELLALVEADIDFSQEPIVFITPGSLKERLRRINQRLEELSAGSMSIERFNLLPHILLLGPPSAGKSTLMNRLSGTSRSICAAAAGTTRDILSAPIALGCGDAILLDAAGVDSREDEIIAQARRRALLVAEQVDLVCIVVDVTEPDGGRVFTLFDSLDVRRAVIAVNKVDLVSAEATEAATARLKDRKVGAVCPISALTGAGCDRLREAIADALGLCETTTMGSALLISERQQAAIRAAKEAIDRAVVLSEGAEATIDCADVLAFELREATDSLGTITGEVTTDDLLGQVFANFCIGK